MSTNDFLPEGYEQPKTGGNYLKFEKGENRFRILSKPIVGWLDWDNNNKPLRFRMPDKPKPINPKKAVKHFWAFVVWDYKSESIKVLEITQSSIQSAITGLTRDGDWGSPFGYDIKVNKTGEGLDTEYTINPVPHKEVSAEIKAAFAAKRVELERLFDNEDPFAVEAVPVGDDDDLPF